MSAVKVDFTIPSDLDERLRQSVEAGKRSNFVADAIREKLAALEREKVRAELREGYLATRDEDAEINRTWEAATLEGWPN